MTVFVCPPDDEDQGARFWEQVLSELREMGFDFAPTRSQAIALHPAKGAPPASL